jgi:hypothetical protein
VKVAVAARQVLDGGGRSLGVIDFRQDLATGPHAAAGRFLADRREVHHDHSTIRGIAATLDETSTFEPVDAGARGCGAGGSATGDLAHLQRTTRVKKPEHLQVFGLANTERTGAQIVGPLNLGLKVSECVCESIEFGHVVNISDIQSSKLSISTIINLFDNISPTDYVDGC